MPYRYFRRISVFGRSLRCLQNTFLGNKNLSKTEKCAFPASDIEFSSSYSCAVINLGVSNVSHRKTDYLEPRKNVTNYSFKRKLSSEQLSVNNVESYVEIYGKLYQIEGKKDYFVEDEAGNKMMIPQHLQDKIFRNKTKKDLLGVNVIVRGNVKKTWSDASHENLGSNIFVSIKEIYIKKGASSVTTDQNSTEAKHPKVRKNRNSVLVRVTEEEASKSGVSGIQYLFSRSHSCGSLGKENISQKVNLAGWVDAIGKNGEFIVLKDGYGSVKLIPGHEDEVLKNHFRFTTVHSMLAVKGTVIQGSWNERSINSGETENNSVEVLVESVKVISNKDDSVKECSDQEKVPEEASTAMKLLDSKIVDSNKYSLRSHTCGELNLSHVGETVRLMGWVEFSRMDKFLVLRDKYGRTQLYIPNTQRNFQKLVKTLPLESVISATGKVHARSPRQINAFEKTGQIEVVVDDIEVINEAATLPYYSKDSTPNEYVRLTNRYLDLRYSSTLRQALSIRCQVLHKMRRFLIEEVGFTEIETPTLFKRTPGGAQEFIVPTRKKGEFFSLVQSPQQLKQLLMIGAMDRYFQIARCYRDEAIRKDRQPEFTQLDIEMSFCEQEGILNLVEDLLVHSWPETLPPLKKGFPRITYKEAMSAYGTDKPDLRFSVKAYDVTELFGSEEVNSKCRVPVQKSLGKDFAARILVASDAMNVYPSAIRQKLSESFKADFEDCTFICFTVGDPHGNHREKLWYNFPNPIAQGIVQTVNYQPGDVFFMVLGPKMNVEQILGKIQSDFSGRFKDEVMGDNVFSFAWVLDFPLFEEVEGKLKSVHHPFTQPHPNDLHLINVDPLKARGLHYDLVLNGCELGGGSIRISDPALQKNIFENVLRLDLSSMNHFLEALSSGAPTHGGIALGVDRLISILTGAHSIRDVIAFPKSAFGRDPLSGAPCDITPEEKAMYHIISES